MFQDYQDKKEEEEYSVPKIYLNCRKQSTIGK